MFRKFFFCLFSLKQHDETVCSLKHCFLRHTQYQRESGVKGESKEEGEYLKMKKNLGVGV